jgi:hypothetical protein
MQNINKFLLISIDSWRYDALSRTNLLLNTPKFDLLTQDFSLAERFFVTAPATRPSHTSLFTGRYPFEHGLYGQTYLKMFAGIPNLFQLFADAGYDIMGRSERSDVFRFLDFDSFITPIDAEAKDQHLASLESLIEWIDQPTKTQQFGFIHFWHTHGGYGLGGIRHAPNLRKWVHEGRTDEALRFYYAAVVHVLEFALVEILRRVSLDEWAVFIFGDHGEGFCEEIMAHGDTLHQNVLHVPLLAHIPGREQLEFPGGPIAMIDLFPTITACAGINVDYHGYGRDLLDPPEAFADRWVLSELDSLYGIGFLNPSNLQTDSSRVTSRVSIDGVEIGKYPEGVRLWAITDGQQFYRENEHNGDFVLRDVMSGADLPCDTPDKFRSIYTDIRANSHYQSPEMQDASAEEEAILAARLRNLGYIE